jgi:hypothetical protein
VRFTCNQRQLVDMVNMLIALSTVRSMLTLHVNRAIYVEQSMLFCYIAIKDFILKTYLTYSQSSSTNS